MYFYKILHYKIKFQRSIIMKKVLLYFFLFCFCISSSQSIYDEWNDPNGKYSKGFNHKNYYSLVGDVKEVEIISETNFNVDSTNKIISSKHKREFNRNGYLVKEYWVQKDNSLFLEEENIFDAKDNLLLKSQYAKRWKRTKDSVMSTNNVNSYQEKYTYNSENKLLTKYQKTNKQKAFYISERYSYKNGKLFKKENLNNHIDTNISSVAMCKGNGYYLNDFVTEYEYNKSGYLANTKTFIDTLQSVRYRDTLVTVHFRDTIIKNLKTSIPTIREDRKLDFSNFILEYEDQFQYDKQNRMISEKTINHYNSYHSEREIIYDYFGNKKQKTLRKPKNGFVSGNLNQYIIIKKDTLLHKTWYFNKKEGEKKLNTEYFYNLDGSFKKNSYSNNKISRVQFYNTRKHLIEERDLRNNTSRQINYKYDNNDNFIEKITLQNGVIKEKITRKISYY